MMYTGMMDCFAKTIRYEGFPALFKVCRSRSSHGNQLERHRMVSSDLLTIHIALSQGLWPNYVKVVPSIAIAFVTYEKVTPFAQT